MRARMPSVCSRRREGVEVGELGPGDRLHLGGGVELHRARAERDHAAVEREVAVGEPAQVAQHRRLGVVRVEDRVGEELGRARQGLGYAVSLRVAPTSASASSAGLTPKASRTASTVAGVDVSSRLSETRSASTRHTLMPRSANGGRDLVGATRHDDRERVEERRRLDVEATVDEGAAQRGREAADALRDGHEARGTVPHGIHARHDGEEHLRGADVGRRLLAADVLLTRLEGEAVGLVTLGVDGHADEAAGDLALETAVHGHVAGVRAAEAHRDAEPLGAADGDVGAPLARGRRPGSARAGRRTP